MPVETTVQRVKADLDAAFDRLDDFFELPINVCQFQMSDGQWTIDEILEHITLTNHFLLITLHQSLKKVLRRAAQQPIPAGESDLDRIVRISDPDAFSWICPEHMEPTRAVSSEAVRKKLQEQREECLTILKQISNGEGALHHVRMSVQNLGKLDMYQWLYFLIQHARRHITEIERICASYEKLLY